MKEKWPAIPTRLSRSWRMSSGTVKLAVALLTKSILNKAAKSEGKGSLMSESAPPLLKSGATDVAVDQKLRIDDGTAQRVQTKNMAGLMRAVDQRPQGQSLVTVSNHASCLDDPVIWSIIPFSTYLSTKKMRWTPAESEIVFTNSLYSWFFSRVQLVPITRGLGVYQRGLDYCLKLVNEGRWVHIFPEGKINMTLQELRLKWGVGRLLAEAATMPTIIPIWHVGMDDILPNRRPYIPRLFKKLTVVIGEPIDTASLLQAREGMRGNAVMIRKHITDVVQRKLYELRDPAESLHRDWIVRSPVAYRDL